MLLMLSWTELMKHAESGTLRLLLDADVEPDRRVEAHLLVDQQMGQLGLERGEVLVRGEVAVGLRPGRDGGDDAVDQLPDAVLPLRRADVAAEVLADHDVRGELAPEDRDLDVLLLEDGLAGLRGDAGRAVLPGDLVVGMDAGAGPPALEREAARPLALEAGTVRAAQALAGGGGDLAPGPARPGLGRDLLIHDRDNLSSLGHCVRSPPFPPWRDHALLPPARMGASSRASRCPGCRAGRDLRAWGSVQLAISRSRKMG